LCESGQNWQNNFFHTPYINFVGVLQAFSRSAKHMLLSSDILAADCVTKEIVYQSITCN
jgi:hypothetical protein